MHSVVRSDFLNGLLFLDRLQRDSCFHLRAEAPPLPRFHFCSLSEAAILYLIDWSEFWGAPHGLCCFPSSGPSCRLKTSWKKCSCPRPAATNWLTARPGYYDGIRAHHRYSTRLNCPRTRTAVIPIFRGDFTSNSKNRTPSTPPGSVLDRAARKSKHATSWFLLGVLPLIDR